MYDTAKPNVFKIVPVKLRSTNIFKSKRPDWVPPVSVQTMGGVKPKPANKPADPAFKNALRQRPLRIGLRYIGD